MQSARKVLLLVLSGANKCPSSLWPPPPLPLIPVTPVIPVLNSDPQSCQSSARAPIGVGGVSLSHTPGWWWPVTDLIVSQSHKKRQRCSSSSDYQRHWLRANIAKSKLLETVNQTVTKTNATTFNQTKTKLLPKLSIDFTDHLYLLVAVISPITSSTYWCFLREPVRILLAGEWLKGWRKVLTCVWLDSSEVSREGEGTLKVEHCLMVLSSRQPESNGTTTSALLWLNLRNVCTFSAVTLCIVS